MQKTASDIGTFVLWTLQKQAADENLGYGHAIGRGVAVGAPVGAVLGIPEMALMMAARGHNFEPWMIPAGIAVGALEGGGAGALIGSAANRARLAKESAAKFAGDDEGTGIGYGRAAGLGALGGGAIGTGVGYGLGPKVFGGPAHDLSGLIADISAERGAANPLSRAIFQATEAKPMARSMGAGAGGALGAVGGLGTALLLNKLFG